MVIFYCDAYISVEGAGGSFEKQFFTCNNGSLSYYLNLIKLTLIPVIATTNLYNATSKELVRWLADLTTQIKIIFFKLSRDP